MKTGRVRYLLSLLGVLWLVLAPALAAVHDLSHLDHDHHDEEDCAFWHGCARADDALPPVLVMPTIRWKSRVEVSRLVPRAVTLNLLGLPRSRAPPLVP